MPYNDDLLDSFVQSAIHRKDNEFLDKIMGGNKETLPPKPNYLASLAPIRDADPDLTVHAPTAPSVPSLTMSLPKKPAAATGNGTGDDGSGDTDDGGNDVKTAIAKKYGFSAGMDDEALQKAQAQSAQD